MSSVFVWTVQDVISLILLGLIALVFGVALFLDWLDRRARRKKK